MVNFLRFMVFLIVVYMIVRLVLWVIGGVLDAVFGIVVPAVLLLFVLYLMRRVSSSMPSRNAP